jgi:type 1 glutamine amidotransferase
VSTATPLIAAIPIAWLLACGSGGSATSPDTTTPGTPPGAAARRLLVVTHTAGFRHDSIPTAEATLQQIGTSSALFDVEFARTADDVQRLLTAESLARFHAVCFANTTGNIGIPDLSAFLRWISGGGGFVGAHSASDTYHESAEFLEMIGGEFDTHGSIAATEVRVDAPSHPAVAHLAPRFTITDELYRFKRFDAEKVMRLLSLDRNPADGVGEAGAAADLPMAWHRTYGEGRVVYTAFGHRQEVWQDPRFQQHLREAIRWVLQP